MKHLVVFPISLGLLFVGNHPAFALSSRSVFEGDVNQGIDLKVWPGYGLTINLLPTHAIIKQAWLGHPGRFLLSSNGSLCPQSLTSQGQSCKNVGASVLLLRLIDPKAFNNPDLPPSIDGSTQVTLIVQKPNGDEQELQFGLLPAQGKPEYTSLRIYPDSEKPKPILPLPPIKQNPIVPRTTSPGLQQPLTPQVSSKPVVGGELQEQEGTGHLVVPLTSSISPALPLATNDERTPARNLPKTSAIILPENNGRAVNTDNSRCTADNPKHGSTIILASAPEAFNSTTTFGATDLLFDAVGADAKNKVQPSTTTIHDTPQITQRDSGPYFSGNIPALVLGRFFLAPPPPVPNQSTSPINLQPVNSSPSPSTETIKNRPQSTDNTTAFAFGLLAGIQIGKIQPGTLVWEQTQNALSRLRQGESIADALNGSKLSPLIFNYFVTLGQQKQLAISDIHKNNINTVSNPPASITSLQISSEDTAIPPNFNSDVVNFSTFPSNSDFSQSQLSYPQSDSVNYAEVATLGLILAKNKGQIKINSPQWHQIKKVIVNLRQGVALKTALIDTNLESFDFQQLVDLGQNYLKNFNSK